MNSRLISFRKSVRSFLNIFFAVPVLFLSAGSCSKRIADEPYEDQVIAENLLISSQNASGGLTLNLTISPEKEYIFELRGKLRHNIPTLRVDSGEDQPEHLRYINPLESGAYFKVRSKGKLRLMIYQDLPFTYELISLRMTATKPNLKSRALDIFDEHISPEKYFIPFPAKFPNP